MLKLDSSIKEPVEKRLDARALVFEKPLVFRAPIRPTPIRLVMSPLGEDMLGRPTGPAGDCASILADEPAPEPPMPAMLRVADGLVDFFVL